MSSSILTPFPTEGIKAVTIQSYGLQTQRWPEFDCLDKSDKYRIVGIKSTGTGTYSRDNAIRDILPFVEWGFLEGLFACGAV